MKSFTKLFKFAASFTLLATAALMVSGCGGGGSSDNNNVSIMTDKAFANGSHHYEIKNVLIAFDITPIPNSGNYDKEARKVTNALVEINAGGDTYEMLCDYTVTVDPTTGEVVKADLEVTLGDFEDIVSEPNLQIVLGVGRDALGTLWVPQRFNIEFRNEYAMTQIVEYTAAQPTIITNRQQVVRPNN